MKLIYNSKALRYNDFRRVNSDYKVLKMKSSVKVINLTNLLL